MFHDLGGVGKYQLIITEEDLVLACSNVDNAIEFDNSTNEEILKVLLLHFRSERDAELKEK